MSDKRDVVDPAASTVYIKEPTRTYPEVAVSCVHFLDNEIQMEQATGRAPVDLNAPVGTNPIVSVSASQALLIADAIYAYLKK
jgi:hypothetical protein